MANIMTLDDQIDGIETHGDCSKHDGDRLIYFLSNLWCFDMQDMSSLQTILIITLVTYERCTISELIATIVLPYD